jgi:hypothetical protein
VRLSSDLAAACRPAGTRDVGWLGRVRDISQGGIGLLLRHRFRPGTSLSVELRESTGTFLRTVLVRVAHATAIVVDGTDYWLLGCAFESPLSDAEFQELS